MRGSSAGSGSGRAAAFFDLDKTVIAKSSTLAFGRSFYQGGLVNRRDLLKGTYAQFVYLVAGADGDQMTRMRDALATMCAGWPVEQVRDIVSETLHGLIRPLVYAEAMELIAEHRGAGRDVVIVSSSGDEVVGPIGEMLGVDDVVATRMQIADGCYTGKIDFYAYGPGKAAAIEEMAANRGYRLEDCYAYSDSLTDLPMLDAVGHPTAVNPDRGLRRIAEERDWPVVHFRYPVRLRDRFPALQHRAARAILRPLVAVILAAGAVDVGWILGRLLRSPEPAPGAQPRRSASQTARLSWTATSTARHRWITNGTGSLSR